MYVESLDIKNEIFAYLKREKLMNYY
jgi:hypothetical protein